jgi:hypothetical protein
LLRPLHFCHLSCINRFGFTCFQQLLWHI